ncbi:hypothetical protein HKD37_10G028793 [Glycine soja]
MIPTHPISCNSHTQPKTQDARDADKNRGIFQLWCSVEIAQVKCVHTVTMGPQPTNMAPHTTWFL